MNKIDQHITQLKKKKEIGLMAHAVLGYPTMEKSLGIIKSLITSGADFLELQIPFSDPVADGETIMKACEVALKKGMNTDMAFNILDFAEVGRVCPIIIMAYYNTVFRYGIDKFCKRASQRGVSGLIVPDIPPEEEKSEKFISTCLKYNIYPIRVVSPSSSIERLKINSKYAKGFVYCVSHFGITGSKVTMGKELFDYLDRVKQIIKLPIAVGFGLSNVEQIKKLEGFTDIAIVGSAIIKNFDAGGTNKVRSFIKNLKESTIREE